MAQWKIFRRQGKLAMMYVNLFTGKGQDCGECEGTCPIDLVIEWVLTKGVAAPGDFISTPSGQLLSISRERGMS